ncbi:sulfite exporter TauE/SafE family protein [uncultured Maribacter sp.]|uniref:sulfite exporter TauE/SafE family protein n=1 Tax=uncultured Maribacter sp. TaxID=431308 RepID=UPI002608BB39|nr:sulfite exporter TauE/SafE family protein [uncultured Maribacter sp.]
MLLSITTEITPTAWILASIATFIIGLSKAGIKGIAVLNVTIMALAFGARQSTGMVVPLLVLADIFAVIYYNRYTQWKYVFKVLPWMIVGLLIGVFIGNELPEKFFKIGMATIIIITVGMMFYWDRQKDKNVPSHWTFAGAIGTIAGITTMVGNLAGAFSNIYFLAMRLPKNQFIGTAAWLFLIINIIKLPFHFFVWETITKESLTLNLMLLPGILIGFFVGIRFIKYIKEAFFRKMILVLTAVGAVLIMLS